MLARAIDDAVARMRADRAAWSQLDDARTRGTVLVGIGYDRRDDDTEVALRRAILEHEVRYHEQEGAIAISDHLRLACFLVVLARDPEDIWTLVRAKLANYDTFCGLDREYLYAAGIDRISEHVRSSSHPQRDKVLAELFDDSGEPWFDADEMTEWWRGVNEYFPAHAEDDQPLVVAQAVLDYGSAAEALPWLARWTRKTPGPHDAPWAAEIAAKIVERDPQLADQVSALSGSWQTRS